MDQPDPHGVRSAALAVLAQHKPDSATGCCTNCGRVIDIRGICDAPEVKDAWAVLNHRPAYRTHGANTRADAY